MILKPHQSPTSHLNGLALSGMTSQQIYDYALANYTKEQIASVISDYENNDEYMGTKVLTVAFWLQYGTKETE